jgi:hypothetical protein
LIVALTSITDFQLIVEHLTASNYSIVGFQRVVKLIQVLISEGACAVPITSYSVSERVQQHSSGDAIETNGINFGGSVSH